MATRRTPLVLKETRPAVLVLAVLLLSYSVSVSPGIVGRAPAMLSSAAVGVGAAVLPNADNTVAAQLAQKEAELNTREAAFNAKEEMTLLSQERFALISFMMSVLLFALLGLNFYLDWRRRGTQPTPARIIIP